MIYRLNEEKIKEQGLTLKETLLVMLISALGNDTLQSLQERMVSREMLSKDPINGTLWIMPKTKTKVENIILDSDSEVPETDKLEKLVQSMMEIFPSSKKPDTPYYFRGNIKDNILRLRKFYKLYGNRYSEEEILDATKRYVASHTPKTMRLMKYFIWKDERKFDPMGKLYVDEHSDLADYLDNRNSSDPYNDDWTTNIREL